MNSLPRTIAVCLMTGVLSVATAPPSDASSDSRTWLQRGFGGGGLFPVVAVDPTPGSDVVYLGSDVAGVYKSSDGGDTWQPFSNGLISLQVASLAIDPSNPQRLWVGTPLGLHRTDDGASSWSVVSAEIHCFKHINQGGIAVSPDGQTLLVAGHDLVGEPAGDDSVFDGVLHRSTDSGATWTEVESFPLVRIPAVVIDPHQPDHAYLLVKGEGVRRSTDGGATWHDFSTGLPADRSWQQLDVGAAVVWATAEPEPGATAAGVFKTSKDSASWASALDVETGEETPQGLPVGDPIRIDPGDDEHVYLGQDGWPFNFYRTSDGGTSWVGTPLDTGYEFDHVNAPHQIWFDPAQGPFDIAVDPHNGDRVFYTTWVSLWRSDDGGATFSENVAGAQNVCSTSVLAGDGFLLSTNMDGGVNRSVDGGLTWTYRYPQEVPPLEYWLHAWALEESPGGDLYFGAGTTDGATVFRSTDQGLTWEATGSGLPRTGDPEIDVYTEVCMAAHPTSPSTLYAGVDRFGIYRTTDSGQTWTEVIDLEGVNGPDEPVVKCLEVDPTNPQRIFHGQFWGGLWYSEDGGGSWQEAEVAGLDWGSVQDIVALADGRVFAAFADGLYLSTDGGHSFARSFPELPNLGEHELEYVEAIAVNPADANDLAASTAKRYPVYYNRGSVWRSTDGAATWSEITGDLPARRVRNLTFSDEALLAATWCAGIYAMPLATTCIPPEITAQPESQTVVGGETATLTVTATGTEPLSYQWYRGASGDVGDPIAGAVASSYTTGALTETFSCWVRVSNACGSADSVTATITVGTAETTRLVLPGQARADGLEGTSWYSELWVYNPHQARTVDLRFWAQGEDNSAAQVLGSLEIGSGSFVDQDDILDYLGLEPPSVGSVVLEFHDGGAPLIAGARTYNDTPEETYGQYIWAVEAPVAGAAPKAEMVLPGAQRSDGFRSNLGLVNLGADPLQMEVSLLGTAETYTVPPFSNLQLNDVFERLGIETDGVGTATVTADGPAYAYLSIIDNRTGDPTYLGPIQARDQGYLPGCARAQGLYDTEWYSDGVFANPGAQPAQLSLTFLPNDQDNSAASPGLELTLEPGETRVLDDLVEGYLEQSGVGTVLFESSQPVQVWARTYNETPEGATYGQTILPVGEDDMTPAATEAVYLFALSDQYFRANLAAFNPTGSAQTLTVVAHDDEADEVGRGSFQLPPMSGIQIVGVLQALGVTDDDAVTIIATADGPSTGYLSMVDNASGDGITVFPAVIE